MLILVIGDLFIAERAIDLPLPFKKLLVPGRIGACLVTGTPSLHAKSYLESIAPIVISTLSRNISKSVKSLVVEFEGWRLGLVEVRERERELLTLTLRQAQYLTREMH